jgi:hypothetical protein
MEAETMATIDSFKLEHKGFTFNVRIMADEFHGAPWKENDYHGEVSDWRRRGYDGHYPKAPGERLLYEDRGSARFYDFAGAVAKARKEGWGSQGDDGLSKGAKAVQAVERDFEYLRQWCNNDWFYIGVVVSVPGLDEDRSVWGIESNADDYIKETARDLADELLADLPNIIDGEIKDLEDLRAKVAALDEDE